MNEILTFDISLFRTIQGGTVLLYQNNTNKEGLESPPPYKNNRNYPSTNLFKILS